jgi:hypothetical protein
MRIKRDDVVLEKSLYRDIKTAGGYVRVQKSCPPPGRRAMWGSADLSYQELVGEPKRWNITPVRFKGLLAVAVA